MLIYLFFFVQVKQVYLFNYVGNMISYEGELDFDNKLNIFLKWQVF